METFTLDARDLAFGLKITPDTIRKFRAGISNCPLLTGLPAPVQQHPKLLWLRSDINAWLESKRTFRAKDSFPPVQQQNGDSYRGTVLKAVESHRQRGRPRKLDVEKGA